MPLARSSNEPRKERNEGTILTRHFPSHGWEGKRKGPARVTSDAPCMCIDRGCVVKLSECFEGCAGTTWQLLLQQQKGMCSMILMVWACTGMLSEQQLGKMVAAAAALAGNQLSSSAFPFSSQQN